MQSVMLILQTVPHYRMGFLDRLHAALAARDIALTVLFGAESGSVPGTVRMERAWARPIPNRLGRVLGMEWVWQPCLKFIGRQDLIVVEQSNRLLVNYVLQALRSKTRFGLAFWGHGRNLQARNSKSLRESLKRSLLCRVDWWFGYTESTAQYLRDSGFPAERITVVNNAIDDSELRGLVACGDDGSTDRDLQRQANHVAVFCGSLHADKRIGFLIAAAKRIRAAVPDFELLVVGDGPCRDAVIDAARDNRWIRWVGRVTGPKRAAYLHTAKVMLMPGLVGLAIVDSFVCACPIVTTDYPFHSPEIAYLDNGRNGLMTADDIDQYAAGVVEILTNATSYRALSEGCRESARRYTLDAMVARFADGVSAALAMRRGESMIEAAEA